MGTPNKRRKRAAPGSVIGYVRVSTEDQAEHGISLDEQRTRIRAYATAHGLKLVRIAADNGKSGKTLAARPGLLEALADLKAGEAAGLIVCKLDRLSRTTLDVLNLVAASEKQGWTLYSIVDQLDTGSAHGELVLTIFAGLAQAERKQVSERTRAALAEKRRRGERISRDPPFGFKFQNDRVVPVAFEQTILRRILALREAGLGALRIANKLNEQGSMNPRSRKAWGRGTIASILRTAERRAQAG